MIHSGGGVYVVFTFADRALMPAIWYCREVLRMPLDEAQALCGKPRDFIKKLKEIILKGVILTA
jgi:hypothetical protein